MGGFSVCSADGMTKGPCEGEVVPVAEICKNLVDDDCDGSIDEGCVCTPGATESCFDGPTWMIGQGACVAGTRTCDAQGNGFGPCVGQVGPAEESCLTPTDDDCDGTANEGCEPCTPGEVNSCYTGPAGTLDVAGCHAGTKTCLSDGTNFGPCIGQTLPTAEVCTSSADESCDGSSSCPGTMLWSKNFSMPDCMAGGSYSLRADDQGNVYLAGHVCPFNSFGIPTTSTGSNGLLAKLDPSGNVVWSIHLGPNASTGRVNGFEFAPNGDLIIAGDVTPTLEFNGFPPLSSGVFLARVTPEGKVLWRKVFAASTAYLSGLDIDASGNLALVGQAYQIDFGGGILQSAGQGDIFVAKLTEKGEHVWSKRYGSTGDEDGEAVAFSPSGDLFVAGWGYGANFGGAMLGNNGGWHIFMAKVDAAGNHVWSRDEGVAAAYGRMAIAVDATGDVLVGGERNGVIDFGGGPAPAKFGSYLVRLDAGGGHKWTRLLETTTGSGFQGINDLRFDTAGNLVVAGNVSGNVDFGAGVVNGGSYEGFVAKYDPLGVPFWVRRYKAPSYTVEGEAVTADMQGNVFFLAGHNGTMTVNTSTYTGAGYVLIKSTP